MNSTSEAPGLNSDGRSVAAIVSGIWEKAEILIRQELKLASAEVDQKIARAKRDLIALGLMGALFFAGFASFVTAVILLVAKSVEPWMAAGLVFLVTSGVGIAIAFRIQREAAKLIPHETIESVKQDVKAIREASK